MNKEASAKSVRHAILAAQAPAVLTIQNFAHGANSACPQTPMGYVRNAKLSLAKLATRISVVAQK